MDARSWKLLHDYFVIEQKHLAWLKQKYYIRDEKGDALFYVERPSRPPFVRSDITIFDDDSRRVRLLVLRQERRFGPSKKRFALVDAASQRLHARIVRDIGESPFRSGWHAQDPNGRTVVTAREDKPAISMAKRLLSFLPYFEHIEATSLADFDLMVTARDGTDRIVGSFDRDLRSLGDKYTLDLRGDPDRHLDRRIALALGIILDTEEGR